MNYIKKIMVTLKYQFAGIVHVVIKANGIVHADESWSDKFYLNQGCLYQLVGGRKTCCLTDHFLLGNFANCEQHQTTSLCELIQTSAWLKNRYSNMSQNAGNDVSERIKFQPFPVEPAPGFSLEGHCVMQVPFN